jgi:hypothetical protein
MGKNLKGDQVKIILNVVRLVLALGASMLTSVAWREHKKRNIAAPPIKGRVDGALETSIDLFSPLAAGCITWSALGRTGVWIAKRFQR